MKYIPINPWLEEQLQKKGGSVLSVLLEVPTSRLSYAQNILSSLGVISNISNIAGVSFISISIDASKIPQLSNIGTVHYNMPRGVMTLTEKKKSVSIKDKFLGKVGVSEVEVPTTPDRFIIDSIMSQPSDYNFIPTSVITDEIKDTPSSKNLTGNGISVAVIDTGFIPTGLHPQINIRPSILLATLPDLPLDAHGHGSHVTTSLLGSEFTHPIRGKVKGVAENAIATHIKALDNTGMGTTDMILKALELAYLGGNKIISMSLGGDAQGGVNDDPESRTLKLLSEKGVIPVVAAGNSGTEWSINSPGISPHAITVGSISHADNQLSWFSSRGEQSSWYKEHQDEYAKDHAQYGEDLIKPDVVCYGGGLSSENSPEKDELIFSGGVGWFAPFYTKLIDGFAAFHGTSQATPFVAGVIAGLLEAGTISSQKDFKNKIATGAKSPYNGYGLVKFSRFGG